MRVAHYLIRGQSGLFYFRLRVPAELRAAVGYVVIKRATGTRCPRTALGIALVISAGYARTFAAMRAGEPMTKPPSIDEIKANLEKGRGSEYVLEHGPNGLRIEATDAADHSRAMEAIAAIGLVGQQRQPAPDCKPMDMGEGIRMWALTLPMDNPGHRKDSKSQRAKVEAFHAWRLARIGRDYSIHDVSRTDCAEYFIACKATITKRGGPPAPRYIENRFLVLAGFFEWAQTSGYYPKGEENNPAPGHANVPKKDRNRRAKTHGWQAFSAKQLAAIFNPGNYGSLRSDAARWLPVMALYTGARSNELAHLEIEDCYEFLGQPLFDFNFLGPHKSLKTDASERKTPVHPDLIALGLWERVKRLEATGETKLFPELSFLAENGPANAGQRAFSRYLGRLNIKPRGHGILGLHSFRDTAIQAMELAGVHEDIRKQYCGHELGERSDHHTAYGADLLPAGLAKHCHPALSFGLDLAALRELLPR